MANYNFYKDHRVELEASGRNPEQKVWRAVLNQAIEDAFGFQTMHLCHYEKIQAKAYVTKRSNDFNIVCENAGINPDVAWKAIQKFKLLKAGIVQAQNQKDKIMTAVIAELNENRAARKRRHPSCQR